MGDSIAVALHRPPRRKALVLAWLKSWYAFRAKYRQFRITPSATAALGPQYRRSRDRIEIDITYMCNLRCLNCNRSISQAPEKLHISLDMIRQFVAESIERNKQWKVIRVLGGEPTLHPEFDKVIAELLKYHAWNPRSSIIVVSNGNGRAVNEVLERIPPQIRIENSAKSGNVQPDFGAFNHAPVDDPAFENADYRNGCDIMETCGMGLTPLGYYPCAIAGGIDRIAGKRIGYANLPQDHDDMTALADDLCRLCGHFKEGHCKPPELRAPLFKQQTSITWVNMFEHRKQSRLQARAQQAAGTDDAAVETAEICD